MSRTGYDLPRTVNNHPGYDMNNVRAYLWSVLCICAANSNQGYGCSHFDEWKNKITETEKEFDKLSIVKSGQTLTFWANSITKIMGKEEET
jgi:hypothetical protein